ncbi:hypothetical protein ACXVWQ_10835, partial [Haemophilus sp. SZY H57]
VDDMIAKSRSGEDHTVILRKLFERLRKFKLRLNPAKCVFGATSSKLLGFVVSSKGIDVDPDKIAAIRDLPPPRTIKEIRGFMGRINYIGRFISNLADTCKPIFKLLRKDISLNWDEDCRATFEHIKTYLQNPSVLPPPTPWTFSKENRILNENSRFRIFASQSDECLTFFTGF